MTETFTDGSLSFIGHEVECIPPWLSKKYCDALRLDFSYCKLRSIRGLKGFQKVKEIILDNNNLTEELDIPELNTVETLTINKNNIQNLEVFLNKVSTSLPKLSYLSMLGNHACPNELISLDNNDDDYQRYRYYVLYILPKLNFLDSTPVTPNERKEAQRVGPYTKIVSSDFNEESVSEDTETRSKSSEYTPLPSSESTGDGNHKSSFGKCRYIYYGKHSEGNRFIVNNDL